MVDYFAKAVRLSIISPASTRINIIPKKRNMIFEGLMNESPSEAWIFDIVAIAPNSVSDIRKPLTIQ
jgi:hypothetical protein